MAAVQSFPSSVPTPAGHNPALAQLADIHLPQNISYWPPAPGWWVLAFLGIISFYGLYRLLRWYIQTRKYRKALLLELGQIKRQWSKQKNIVLTSAKVSTLLRRYAVDQGHRAQVASKSDRAWISYLEKLLKLHEFEKNYHELILELPYQDPLIKFDLEYQNVIGVKINTLLNKLNVVFIKSKKPGRIANV